MTFLRDDDSGGIWWGSGFDKCAGHRLRLGNSRRSSWWRVGSLAGSIFPYISVLFGLLPAHPSALTLVHTHLTHGTNKKNRVGHKAAGVPEEEEEEEEEEDGINEVEATFRRDNGTTVLLMPHKLHHLLLATVQKCAHIHIRACEQSLRLRRHALCTLEHCLKPLCCNHNCRTMYTDLLTIAAQSTV